MSFTICVYIENHVYFSTVIVPVFSCFLDILFSQTWPLKKATACTKHQVSVELYKKGLGHREVTHFYSGILSEEREQGIAVELTQTSVKLS